MKGLSRRQFGLGLAGAAGLASLSACAAAPMAQQGPAMASTDADILSHVDPELRPIARRMLENSGADGFTMETLLSSRGGGAAFAPPWLKDVPVREEMIPVGEGHPDVKIFVINERPGAAQPAILHIHGGGYILAEAGWEVGHLQPIARDLGCAIVTVDYRLAPETRFTGSVEDNYAGLLWLYRNAESLGVDTQRIAIMGESAGGGHAALLAFAARDRDEVPVALQVLVYPMLDDRTGSARRVQPPIGSIGWGPASNRFGWESFLGEKPGEPNVNPAGVPARRTDLEGLPPAFVGVGGIDLFVDEDIDYARRLTNAGVMTELLVVPGAFHGFDRIAPETTPARLFTHAKMNALRRAFGQPLKI